MWDSATQCKTVQKKSSWHVEGGRTSYSWDTAGCVVGVKTITLYWHITDCNRYSAQDAKTDRKRIPALERKISSFSINCFLSSSVHHLQHVTLIINPQNASRLKFPAVYFLETFKEKSSILQHKSPAVLTWYWHVQIHSCSARTGKGKLYLSSVDFCIVDLETQAEVERTDFSNYTLCTTSGSEEQSGNLLVQGSPFSS